MTEKSQSNREIEEQVRLTQLEEKNEALDRDLAESIQREKDAAQNILDLSDELLRANKNLDGYGKEKTASIIIKQGQRPLIELTGHWAARDWQGLHRQFLETVRRQPPIKVDADSSEDEPPDFSGQEPATALVDKNTELTAENESLTNKTEVLTAENEALTMEAVNARQEIKRLKVKLEPDFKKGVKSK